MPTPPNEDGSVDLRFIEKVAREIAPAIDEYKVVVDKSTVPVRTGEKVAETIQRFEPEAAATWASTISDPDQRSKQLTESIRTWGKGKPHAALEWVISSDLAPAEKEQLASEIGFD